MITRLRAVGIALTLLSGSGCTVGCGTTHPTPVVDEVLALPSSGPPRLVPQSLGGEYRALPESTASARGVALRLHNVPNTSDLVIYLDGNPLPPGSTSGAIPAGSSGVFSASSLAGATQATILLPLAQGATRSRMTIAASNGTSGGRASVVVDTVSGGMAARTEPSDVYFCTRPDTFFLWQRIASGCLHPDRVVAHDVVVAGWLLSHSPSFASDGTLAQPYPVAVNRNCNHYCEDVHYYFLLDPTFLSQTYNQQGVDTVLTGAHLPGVSSGDPSSPDPSPYLITDSVGGTPGSPQAVTINSFAIPNSSCGFHAAIAAPFDALTCIKGEQPAWHVADTPPVSIFGCYCPHAKGLGSPPIGWQTVPTHPTIDPTTAYAYNPMTGIERFTRANGSSALRFGDYVLVKATLYEDGPHGAPGCFPRGLWNSGWLELHSIDWITKIDPPARATTSGRVAACVDKGGSPTPVDQDISPPSAWFVQRDSNDTLHYCTLIDERFTTLGQVSGLQIQKTSSNVIHVSLTLNPSAAQNAAFTASIVMWWAGPSNQTLDSACQGAPSS